MIVMIQRQWFFISVFLYLGLYTECVFVIMIISVENSWVINKTQSVIQSADWLAERFHIFITASCVAVSCKYIFTFQAANQNQSLTIGLFIMMLLKFLEMSASSNTEQSFL